jgi:membrane protein YdbS with pleckstrin-like domain
MRASPRRHLSYASFVLLLAVDVLALLALLFNQLVTVGPGVVWLLSAVLTAGAMPALLRLADKVFAMARALRNVPVTGESFP